MTVQVITSSDELAALCHRLAGAAFITVDTEFMRETTFWPKLCLAQKVVSPTCSGLNWLQVWVR